MFKINVYLFCKNIPTWLHISTMKIGAMKDINEQKLKTFTERKTGH